MLAYCKRGCYLMNYNEYIKIQNLMHIYDFYGLNFLSLEGSDDMWSSRAMMLLKSMCQLENDNQYPLSSDLPDLIDFSENNPEAVGITNYIQCLPGFKPSLGKNQTSDTYRQHGFITMNFYNLKIRNDKHMEDYCNFKLDGKYRLRKNLTGIYLTIDFEDITVTLEKRNEFLEKSFRVNGTMVDNVEFHELVNMISYACHVKEINKENTQAAHFFLG